MLGGDALYCRASSGALSYAQAGRAVAGLAGQLGTEVRGRPVVLSLRPKRSSPKNSSLLMILAPPENPS